MGSSRKSILRMCFCALSESDRGREIHSFKDIVDAFRQEEVDPVDKGDSDNRKSTIIKT